MSVDSEKRTLNTISVAFDIICFIKDNNGVRFKDIDNKYSMAKSTVYGYTSTLEELGLIIKEDGKYYLGLELFHLGESAKNKNEYFKLAKPMVNKLANETGEGADFMVYENGMLFTIYHEISNRSDPNFQAGKRFYTHNSAGGKAMLACLSNDEIVEIINSYKLPKETENTITDTDELLQEIEAIREQGYAVCDEEFMNGVRSVGTAVTFPDGEIFGTLAVGGPTYRMNDNRIENRIAKTLLKASEKLEQEISQRDALSK